MKDVAQKDVVRNVVWSTVKNVQSRRYVQDVVRKVVKNVVWT